MPNYVWILLVVVVVLAAKHIFIGKAPLRVVQEKLGQGALVVDVRTEAEFAGEHYQGARNIPLSDLSSRVDELGGKTDPIVVYCHSGARAGAASRVLKSAGFTNVVNAGTLRAMNHAGLTTN